MAALMEDVLFELPDYPEKRIGFDTENVRERLVRIISDDDLRRYILSVRSGHTFASPTLITHYSR